MVRDYFESNVHVSERFENNGVVVDHCLPVLRLLSYGDVRPENVLYKQRH